CRCCSHATDCGASTSVRRAPRAPPRRKTTATPPDHAPCPPSPAVFRRGFVFSAGLERWFARPDLVAATARRLFHANGLTALGHPTSFRGRPAHETTPGCRHRSRNARRRHRRFHAIVLGSEPREQARPRAADQFQPPAPCRKARHGLSVLP